MKRQSACVRNDALIRELAIQEGQSLAAIARRIGTNHHRVADYIKLHNIPHVPFVTWRTGERNNKWRGGRIIDKDGYVLLKRLDHPHRDRHGYVREHRLVMEQTLDRLLEPQEVVHHIDGNKQNNHPDNLEVYARNSDHLAATLKGKCPQWTEDGKRRIAEGIAQAVKRRQAASRQRLKHNAPK